MPERIDFWGVPQPWGPILVYGIVTLAFVIMLVRFYREASLWWKVGLPTKRWDKPLTRAWKVIEYAVFQLRVLAQRYPGVMHVALAWAFFVFFLGTALATINGHFFKFLVGSPYLGYKLILDTFTLVFLIGAVLAGYRRFLQKPSRLTLEPRFTLSLLFIVFIVVNGLLVESFRLAIQRPAWAVWSPIGWGIAQLWIATGVSEAALHGWHLGLYSLHFLTVSALFITLPTSTLLHIFTGPVNAFFVDLNRPAGKLAAMTQTDKSEPRYAATLKDLKWTQLMQADTCTECGRCQDACPVFAAGLPLSPKQLMVDLRTALRRDGPRINGKPAPILTGVDIQNQALWACTTCGSCDQECPVLIQHVDLIVDMRRYLVSEGQMDSLLQDSLSSLSRYGNAFSQSERARMRWSATLTNKIKDARREPVEYLWFLGDTAAYNPGLVDVTRATADVFTRIGLNFGTMYEAERNAGNDVRRVGEEGLYEYLVEKNAMALAKCDFKTIITTDPHSYNTLKNEYSPDALCGRPVMHYTELLDQLVTTGELKFTRPINRRVTYHDPCYLGRYNGIYDAPRRLLTSMGCELVEMPRNRAQSLCCAAGGGRIWMEEGDIKERPSENRIKEAAALDNVSTFVVACPKDVVMYQDAVKTTGVDEKLQVKELIELVREAL